MALDSLNNRKGKRGKVLRIRLKEAQYRLFLEYCRSQNTTPVRLLKKEIKQSLEEFITMKEEGLIPEQNQLFLFDEEVPAKNGKAKDREEFNEESQLKLF